VTLGSYHPGVAAAWDALDDQMEAWRRASQLWDPAGDRRARRALLLGVVAALLGLVAVFFGGFVANARDSVWQALVVVGAISAGAGLALMVRGWELRVRTPTGTALWMRVESFRRFLAGCGPHQADEAAKVGQLGQYTAWAVALGVIDCWSTAITASTVARSRRAPMYGYHPMMANPALASAILASTTEPSVTVSGSSSSGGGSGSSSSGGGSVGGGSGGGGGGSW
jgi:uncharacterized membrane protein